MTLLTVAEVAYQLSLTPKTVRKMIKAGKLPGIRLGRQWRIDEEQVVLFVRRRAI